MGNCCAGSDDKKTNMDVSHAKMLLYLVFSI